MSKNKLAIFGTLGFSLLVVLFSTYIYIANGFIYHRIGSAHFTLPHREQVYYMNPTLATTSNVYIALGDSLTAGSGADLYEETYPYLVAKQLSNHNQEVILRNFSVPGFKSQDLIDVFLENTVKMQPDIVTILIGVNDIHNYVGEERFAKNYRTILEVLTQHTKAKIYLISIPYIGADTTIFPPLNLYFLNQTTEYNKVIKELSQEYHATYIDLDTPTRALFRKDGAHYSVDGFHPSAAGYKIWADIIYDGLR